MSFGSISEQLNVSKPTLIGWSKERKEDIGNMRQLHLEALREKYRMGEERRLELFAKQLDAVEGELGKRDLTSLLTERLFDILAKLGRELNTMNAPMTFQRREEPDLGDMLRSTVAWQA